MKSLTLVGVRWRTDYDGNIFVRHTAEIIIDGHFVHKSEVTCGPGNQYMDTAETWLFANGYLPKKSNGPIKRYCEENNITWYSTCVDLS